MPEIRNSSTERNKKKRGNSNRPSKAERKLSDANLTGTMRGQGRDKAIAREVIRRLKGRG